MESAGIFVREIFSTLEEVKEIFSRVQLSSCVFGPDVSLHNPLNSPYEDAKASRR